MQLDTKPVRDACLLNAARLLNAAKKVRDPESRHISYHLTALALEEVGKASMVTIGSLSAASADGSEEDEDPNGSVQRLEDHERELFWALFLPGFHPTITADQFRRYQSLARNIHKTRLATLYVDPTPEPDTSVQITDEELNILLALTEARLNMEAGKDYLPLDEIARQNLTWFLSAIEQPQLRMIVLSPTFVEKLDELGGNYNSWFSWIRQRLVEIEKMNRELAEAELRRAPPSEVEAGKPKWQLRIRLRSSSHSIRPKPLATWNQHVDKIKLYNTPDKQELLVHLTMVKGIPLQALWQSGETISRLFVIALNIGSFGFFWWYTPSFVSKYYEKIVDLENNAEVVLEPSPSLVVSLQMRALKAPDLTNVSVVLALLIHADTDAKQEPYRRYFTAVSLLAKTDVFVQFGANILVEFFESFRAGLAAYGEWDGKDETFGTAAEQAFRELNFPSDFLNEVKRMFQLAREVGAQKASTVPISLDDTMKMKTFCDLFFVVRARHEIQRRAISTVGSTD